MFDIMANDMFFIDNFQFSHPKYNTDIISTNKIMMTSFARDLNGSVPIWRQMEIDYKCAPANFIFQYRQLFGVGTSYTD